MASYRETHSTKGTTEELVFKKDKTSLEVYIVGISHSQRHSIIGEGGVGFYSTCLFHGERSGRPHWIFSHHLAEEKEFLDSLFYQVYTHWRMGDYQSKRDENPYISTYLKRSRLP